MLSYKCAAYKDPCISLREKGLLFMNNRGHEVGCRAQDIDTSGSFLHPASDRRQPPERGHCEP